jgi:hypothetical protein
MRETSAADDMHQARFPRHWCIPTELHFEPPGLRRGSSRGVTQDNGNTKETRIRGALTLALATISLVGAFGCSSVDEEPGAVRGRFVENIARFDDGRAEVTYSLFRGKGRSDRRELVFEKAPELLSNTEIKVWGTESAGRIEVDHFEVIGDAPQKGPLGKSREALIDAAPMAPTNMVMVLVNTGAGLDITPDVAHAELFSETDPTALVHYYLENSYGMHTLTGQVARGTYMHDMAGACDYEALAEALVDQVHTDTGVPEFDLYLWYFPRTENCAWSGLSSGTDTYYNGSSQNNGTASLGASCSRRNQDTPSASRIRRV